MKVYSYVVMLKRSTITIIIWLILEIMLFYIFLKVQYLYPYFIVQYFLSYQLRLYLKLKDMIITKTLIS